VAREISYELAMASASRSKLLAYRRSLPHATEDVKWGADLMFSIVGKMFAGFSSRRPI
jgi:hypothetical protein